MGRFSARGSVLEVDYPRATLSWDFCDANENPLKIVAVCPLFIRGSECFAVALHGAEGQAELRIVCASASISSPKKLTVLIVECPEEHAPTAMCGVAGGDLAPGLAGKCILGVGSLSGLVSMFDINLIFRLGPCRENHIRTGDTVAISWDDFHSFCGRCLLGYSKAGPSEGELSTNGAGTASQYSAKEALGPIVALHFIPSGGCLHQAHVAVVTRACDNANGGSSTSTILLANISSDPSRMYSSALALPVVFRCEAGSVGFCELCHVHMRSGKAGPSSNLSGQTLVWLVSDCVALVFKITGTSNGALPDIREVHRFETLSGSGALENFLGVVPQPGGMCALISSGREGASIKVDLIDLLGKSGSDQEQSLVVDSLSLDTTNQLPRGFRIASREKIRASVCIDWETTRSLTKSMPAPKIQRVSVSTPIIPAVPSDELSMQMTQWATAFYLRPRAHARNEIMDYGRQILELCDDAFVGRLADDYGGIGLDDEASALRNRFRKAGSAEELLTSINNPILNNVKVLRDVIGEIISGEQHFSQKQDVQAKKTMLRHKAVLDAMLDTGSVDSICSLLIHADGRTWQSVNLWARELLVVYAALLEQTIAGPASGCLGDSSADLDENGWNTTKSSDALAKCTEKMSRISTVLLSIQSIFDASLDTVQEAFEGYGSEADLQSLSSTTESLYDMANTCLWFLNYSSSEVALSFDALHRQRSDNDDKSMPEKRRSRRLLEFHDAEELIGGGDTAFYGDSGSTDSIYKASRIAPLLFGEELALLVEKGCPGASNVLQSGYRELAKHHISSTMPHETPIHFPPRRFRDLMHLFVVGDEVMVGKSCLALYTALDLCYTALNTESWILTLDQQYQKLVDTAADFANTCGIDEQTRSAVLALWHIDNHGDVNLAINLLLSENVTLEPGWHFKVVRALADGWTSGRDALHYLNSLGLKPASASEAITTVRLLLQCGSWEEAFLTQRSICDNFLRTGELSADPVWQLRQTLLQMCFRWLMTTPERVDYLLCLPVRSGDEERIMTKYLTLASFGDGQEHHNTSTAALGILLAHLVFHSKIEEARCIEAIASRVGKDSLHDSKAHDAALGRIMEKFKSLSPAASRLSQDRIVAAAVAESQKMASRYSISDTILDVLKGVFRTKTSLHAYEFEESHLSGKSSDGNDESESAIPGYDFSKEPGVPHKLRTPAKSLLRVAATNSPKDFAKKYSPSMLSPVVKGLSPFSTGPEDTKGITSDRTLQGQKNGPRRHAPSTPSRLRMEQNSSFKIANQVISEMERSPPRRASLTF